MKKQFVLILFIIALCIHLANNSHAQKSLKKQAELLLSKQNYVEALKTLEVYNNINSDESALFIKGICQYNLNKQADCIASMKASFKLGNLNPKIYLYCAKSYQDLAQFSEASNYFKYYLNTLDKNQKSEIESTIQEIKRCELSEKITFLPQIAYIENFGLSVNSAYDEITPLQSRNFQNKYYFSSNRDGAVGGARAADGSIDELGGHYNFDMYATELNKGNYNPAMVFQIQNTPQNEIIQDFSVGGDIMYYLRYNSKNSMKFIADTFTESTDVLAEGDFNFFVNPSLGDKDFSFFNDSTLFFASKRLEGFGGYDIFAMRKTNGIWFEPVNLGNRINSKYDETGPYITKGGNTLFFTSNHINGLGGMDIFASQYNTSTRTWSNRINLGIPINSTKDDIDPLITNDGTQILLSSNRIGGNGGFDLYVAYLKDQLNDQFVYTETLPFFESQDFSADTSISSSNVVDENKIDNNIVKKVLINAPIYYATDENFISNINTSSLKNLKTILEIFPEITINLIGHSGLDIQKDNSLFFTIKRVEKVADYLVGMGIDTKRIFLHSYGHSFPIISNSESRLNSRIDIVLDNVNKDYLDITEERPSLNKDLVNMAYEDYQNLLNKLVYKVRIASTKQMMKSDLLIEYPYISIYKNKNGEYEYYVGYKGSYEEANQLKITMQSKGISTAKITAFVNHTEVTNENIASFVKSYPDLIEYQQKEK